MVFDSFGVGHGGLGGDTDGLEEGEDDGVAMPGFEGQATAIVGEEDGAIRLGSDEAIALQAADGLDHGDVGDAETAGDVDGPGFAGDVDEIGDGFHVILGHLGAVLLADAAMMPGLFFGAGAWGGGDGWGGGGFGFPGSGLDRVGHRM